MKRWSIHLVPTALFLSATAQAAEVNGIVFFESKIRPLLIERCVECHGEKKHKGDLRLDSRAAWQKGGESGAVITPGDPEASLLIKAVRYADKDLQMPPKRQLAPEEIATLEQWVKMGAPDPRDANAPAPSKSVDFVEGRKQWAFQPVGHPQPPNFAPEPSNGHELDRFVFARLREARLQASAPADRRTLIRRVTFDLLGLPPTAEEVDAFVRDKTPDAFAKVVDRLLGSPHYGEHWARHWLDVARYSDTKGYVYAREEKQFVHAWPYRDWVVRALNDDMPYDRFLLLQLAADQVEPAASPHLAAMGFLTLGRRFLGVTHDIIDDRIDVVLRTTQALTVACARCHDHKFDPISTRDYYALYGVFQSCAEALVPCSAAKNEELTALLNKNRELITKRREEQMARTHSRMSDYLDAQSALEKYPKEGFDQILEANDLNPFIVHHFTSWLKKGGITAGEVKAMSPSDLDRLFAGIDSPVHVPDEHIANIEMYFPTNITTELWKAQGEVDRYLLQTASAPAYATVLQDRPLPTTPRVFKRGNPLTKGEEVPRRFLQVLAGDQPQPFVNGSGRLELAQAIIAPGNPLTARVMVNRVWMQHFGRGLITTPSDFGKRAEPPSHPELLDWLARRFMDEGWSLKSLHRRILLSATYQQSSLASAATKAQELDPDNRLLWRMNTHRLSFEEMRDAWLAATEELDLHVGGKPAELFASGNVRRTLYARVDREHLPTVMRTFDFANPDLTIPQRNDTIVPQQALFGLNHPFLAARAKAVMRRIGDTDDAGRVRRLYELLFQRKPTSAEMDAALAFVQPESPAPAKREKPNAWQYGYGEWDEVAGRMKSFTALPLFNGTAWQGGEEWPDKKLGWAQLTARGGHPGNDQSHAVARRWVAPQDGSYAIASTLIHEPAAGDGIRAFISHSGRGLLRSTTLHHSTAALNVEAMPLSAGDTLDFVVDIRDGLNSDQFVWSPKIFIVASGGSGGDDAPSWDAQKDFAGPNSAPLSLWQQLAQTLMLTNEFVFVD